MKTLRLIGLGILIWGLSLLWPQVNQLLTPQVMTWVALGLSAAFLAYTLSQRLDYPHHNNKAGQDHSSRPTMPVVVPR
jgi:hypothetical protein